MQKFILRKPTLLAFMAIGFSTLYGGQAQASCDAAQRVISTLGSSSVEISVPPSARPGDKIHGSESAGSPGTLILKCRSGPSSRTSRFLEYGAPTAWNGVVTTRIPGIGIKLTYTDASALEMGDTAPRTLPYTHQTSYSAPIEVNYGGRMMAEYYLIDDTFVGGRFPASGTLAQRFGDDLNWPTQNINYNGVSVIRGGCAIDIADLTQTVMLNEVNVSQFNGPGSGSSWVPITLRSQGCDLGSFSQVQLSASNTNPDPNNPTLFATTGAGRGVGVELRERNTGARIEPGKQVTFPTVAAGDVYRLDARYTRTVAPLRLGVANSTITINVDYL